MAALWAMSSCRGNDAELSLSQRELGELKSDALDLSAELIPGLWRSIDEQEALLTGRASAGVGRFTIRSGAESPETLRLALSNVHPRAKLNARRLRRLTQDETLGEECAEAQLAPFDVTCSGEGAEEARCAPRPVERAGTQAIFEIAVAPCAEATYELELDAETRLEPLSFVVVGSMDNLETLSQIVSAERELGHEHDFYMLLGDALEASGSAFISDLDRTLRELQIVAVLTPGEEEIGEDQGQYYEQRFGAFEYRFTLKGTQLVTFYSARQRLNSRGLVTLNGSLRAMLAEDQRVRASRELEPGQTRALGALAFTHTPPFDPNGPRGAGLQSRLEAAQVTSLLSAAGVHTLFAGHILDQAQVVDSRPQLVLTASQDTRRDDTFATYRRVTVSREPLGEQSVPIAQRHLLIETLTAP